MKQHVTHVRQVEMHWAEAGSGKPVVLLHGNYGSKRWFTRQLMDPPEGVRLIAPDLPNFGASGTMREPISMENYAAYVLEFADAVGLDDFALLGHSLGGSVAQTVAVTAPQRVTHLMLLASASPAGHFTSQEHLAIMELFKGNRDLLHKALSGTIPTNRPDWFGEIVDDAMAMRHEAYTGNAIALMEHDITARTADYGGPVLVIYGALDQPHLNTPEIAGSTAGAYPRGRMETWDDVGHSPQIEAPGRFARTLSDFLREKP